MKTHAMRKCLAHRIRGATALSLFVILIASGALRSATAATDELSVLADFDVTQPIKPDTPIAFHLNRELKDTDGRLAIIIARTDLTSLFVISGTRLTYVPTLFPLPLGDTELVFYRVASSGEWSELSRIALQVVKEKPAPVSTPTPSPQPQTAANSPTVVSQPRAPESQTPSATSVDPGTAKAPAEPATTKATSETKFKFTPSLTFAVKSQMAQFNFPANTRPTERATFTDETLQFSLRSEGSHGWLSSQTQIDFAGSSFQQEALRFGTLGTSAPNIDLASYLVQLKIGPAKVAIGHTSFGSSRQLINGFSSRGITVTLPITKRFDFSIAAMNGTNVVGYGNIFGVSKSRHQLESATLGVELLTKRPGGFRIEFSGVTAYVQALNSITQGSVNDVETSKGGSVRLIFTDKAQRFRFDGGFTRSRYRNPADPLLYQGTNTIAVPFLTRNAHYFDISYDVLRGFALTKSRQMSLNIAVRHEQVDPLFKSLGASTQADKRSDEFSVSGNIGEITFQAGGTRFNDNLRHIPSILESLTRAQRFSVAAPAAAFFGKTAKSHLAPRLSYSFDRTHQFGASIPVNGGFGTNPSLIPNQSGTNQTFSAEWQFKKINAGYTYNHSFTDNRQPGRALADFRNQTHTSRVGFKPRSSLSLDFELTRESANDLESAKLNTTWRVGTTATWNINKHIVWTGGIANTVAGDRARTSDSRNTDFDTQFSYRVGVERGGLKKVQTQLFIRYADRYARRQEFLLGTASLTRVKLLNGGLNITFF